MSLPSFNTKIQEFSLMQSEWAKQLDPLLRNPSNKSNILSKITLVIGNNTINHLLGRKLQGWRIIRQRGPASIYDDQDDNPMPQATLVLVSNAIVSVDIEVF